MNPDIKEASAPTWKVVLWTLVGMLGIAAAIFGLVWLFKGKGPIKGSEAAIEATTTKLENLDLQAKLDKAKALQDQQAVVKELEAIQAIEDRRERLARLAKLMEG